MIHVSASFAVMDYSTPEFLFGNLFDSLSRAGVPLFVMISGSLMLDENYTFTKQKWLAHIKKMLLFFFFWSIAHCLAFQILSPLVQNEPIDISSVIWSIFKGHYHLWFVPMIIGLYLLVPLFRLWVNIQNRKYVEYFLLLSIVFSFSLPQCLRLLTYFNPAFESVIRLVDSWQIKYPLGYTAYFLLGWYMHHFELTHRKVIYALGICGGIFTFLGTYFMFAFTQASEFPFYDNFTLNVLFYSISIFHFFKSTQGNQPYTSSLLHRIVSLICKYSLGIYAVHAGLIPVVVKLLPQMQAVLAIPSIFVASFLLSLLVSVVISKLPLIHKFI